jgi:hypothetical protein
LAALVVGLLFVGANALHAPPPEAMVVEVVTPDELPRFEGRPSARHSSGSETPSPSVGKGAVTQAPPPAPRPQPQQQAQQRPNPQREAKEAAAENVPVSEATQAELERAEKTEPEKQNPSEAQSATEPPQRTPEQPNFAEAVAQYVALGSGFAAPPVDTNVSDYNWTAPFRERVGSCSKKPEGVEPGDKITIKIRISFKRDGTVAALPRLLVPAPSAKQQALMDSAVDALERCQPFTMLPPERYKQWKTMEVYVTPLFAHW